MFTITLKPNSQLLQRVPGTFRSIVRYNPKPKPTAIATSAFCSIVRYNPETKLAAIATSTFHSIVRYNPKPKPVAIATSTFRSIVRYNPKTKPVAIATSTFRSIVCSNLINLELVVLSMLVLSPIDMLTGKDKRVPSIQFQ